MHLWLNITEIGFKNNIKQSWTFLFLIMDMTNSSEHVLLIATPCDGLFNSLNGHCVFWQDVVINASVFFLGFCIIFTNIWIIWNLFSRSNDEDTSLVILMNLAIADTFTGGIVMYDTVYNITQFSVYVECILRIGVFIFCSLSSGLIIMLLTFERLFKITNPYSYRKYFTVKRTKVGLVVVWMTSIMVGLLPFFGWSSKNVLYLCSFFRTMSGSYIVFVLTLHVIPFLCTLCAYLWMVTVVRRHVTAIKQIRRTAGRRARGRSTSRAVVTTLIVVGVYFLCWAPIGIMSVVVKKDEKLYLTFTQIKGILRIRYCSISNLSVTSRASAWKQHFNS